MIHAELPTRVPESFSQLLLLKTHFSRLELTQNSSLKGIAVPLGRFALVFHQEGVPSVLIRFTNLVVQAINSQKKL